MTVSPTATRTGIDEPGAAEHGRGSGGGRVGDDLIGRGSSVLRAEGQCFVQVVLAGRKQDGGSSAVAARQRPDRLLGRGERVGLGRGPR